MPKAISYIRFSAIHQGKGSTIARQNELVDRWFENNPEVKHSDISATDHGKSGYHGTNQKHGLGKILNAVQTGEIEAGDFVLVEAIDRIGRLEPLEMFNLISSIVSADITIITLEDNQVYSRNSLNENSGSFYILIGKVQQAHSYSKQLSGRIKKSYEQRRKLARAGKEIALPSPNWLTGNKLHPENSKMVLDAIELYLKGYGTRKIILELTSKHPQIASVYPTTLKRWFTNRVLIGEWETENSLIPNVFEPLVTTEIFYKLQKEIKQRSITHGPEQTYSISGLIECNHCQKRFHLRRKVYKDYVIQYANCSNYLRRGKPYCSNNKTWPIEVLDYIYEETHFNSMWKVATKSTKSGTLTNIETKMAEIDESNDMLKKLLKLYTSDSENNPLLMDMYSEKDTQNKVLKAELALLEQQWKDSDNLPDDFEINDLLLELSDDPVGKRSILFKSGYRILIDGDCALVGSSKYKLLRKSTALNCYLVEEHFPEYECETFDNSGEFITASEGINLLGIDRSGLIAFKPDDKLGWEYFKDNFNNYLV